ncbi:MAG: hypothetical protein AAB354_01115 [candidate division KSB1 bacterium]
MIQKVREEIGELDERSRQLLATAMKIIQSNGGENKPSANEEFFLSRNLSLEDYRSLARPERRRYQSAAEAQNQRWIDEHFQALGANWIMVIDGRIVKYGASLEDYPGDDEMRELREKAGKIPFVFFSKILLAIEETAAPWHKTTAPGDFYPTLAISLSSSNNRSAVICVDNWQRSSFVNINPRRTFLLGRRLLLNLRPRVMLDFDARQSEVQFKEQTS